MFLILAHNVYAKSIKFVELQKGCLLPKTGLSSIQNFAISLGVGMNL